MVDTLFLYDNFWHFDSCFCPQEERIVVVQSQAARLLGQGRRRPIIGPKMAQW